MLFSHQIVVQSRVKHLFVIVEVSIRVIIIDSKGTAVPLRIIPINILLSDSEIVYTVIVYFCFTFEFVSLLDISI